VVVVAFDRQQRAAVELGAMETARALMNAVDRELTGSIAALEALASARGLDHDDLATPPGAGSGVRPARRQAGGSQPPSRADRGAVTVVGSGAPVAHRVAGVVR